MKVKILRDTVADGRDVYVGDVEDISESDARLLIRMKKALPADGEEEAPAKPVLSTSNGPEAKALEAMTKAELLAEAEKLKVEGVDSSMKKADIIDAIKAVQTNKDDFQE